MSADPRTDPRTVIDDLTFADLSEIARAELPGSSDGAWTLHGAVDPGITLLDALEYQLEQRLFMADQRTDPVLWAALSLLGRDAPSPATPARTVLGFVSPTPTGTVSAGTELVLAGDDDARTFVLVDDVDVVAGIRVEVVDGAVRPGDSVRFVVTGTFVATSVVSMYVEVDAPRIASSWSPDAVDVAPASTIAWTAVGADGTRAAVTMDDSTGGFRRAGLLRFDWPDVWQVAGSGDRALEARLVDGFHTEPIRIERVVVNAGVAEHRVPVRADVSDQVGRFLPLPHQRIVLPAGSAGAVLDGPDDLRVELQEADGESHDWPGVRTWVGVGPADRVVRVDRDRGHVEFGDGRRGRIPRPLDGGTAVVAYHLGGGPSGDVSAQRTWRGHGTPLEAIGLVAAVGADAESMEASRQRSMDALGAVHRTVTAHDVEEIARSTPGVDIARAHALVGHHPRFPCAVTPGAISVVVIPAVDRPAPTASWVRAPLADPGAMAAVRAGLERSRLLTQELFVLDPVYRRASVTVRITGGDRSAAIETTIREALVRFFDPLVGGPTGSGWGLGAPLRPSAVVGVLQPVVGPEASVIDVRLELDDDLPSDCKDLTLGGHELPHLVGVAVVWSGALPDGGGLR